MVTLSKEHNSKENISVEHYFKLASLKQQDDWK